MWSRAEPAPVTATRMTLRNRGEPSGFSKIAAPLMERMMRRENRKDLDLLRSILEGDAAAPGGAAH